MTIYYTGNIKTRKVHVTGGGASSFLADGKSFVWGREDQSMDLALALIAHARGVQRDDVDLDTAARFTVQHVSEWPHHDPFTISDDRILELLNGYEAETRR